MRQTAGLTLVELMIALVITSILLAVGIPSLTEYMANNKVRAVADSYQAGLQQARSEAITRNALVSFIPNGSGWTVNQVTPELTISTHSPAQSENTIAVNPSLATINFNSRGRTAGPAGLTVSFTSPTDGACIANGGVVRCLQVLVSSGGQIKLCDPSLPVTDPRAC